MSDDDATPIHGRRSGEHPVSYNELLSELREIRRENKASALEITRKIDGISSELRDGERKFEQHHARISATERWQEEHDDHHRELREEKRREQEEARQSQKSGPHWAVQAAVTTAISIVTSGVVGGLIYVLVQAPKAVGP